jgi:virulence-associated protein VagC
MDSTMTTKVFKCGNSQAVRLPKGFRFRAKNLIVKKTADGVQLIDPGARARRLRALDEIYKHPIDLPEDVGDR